VVELTIDRVGSRVYNKPLTSSNQCLTAAGKSVHGMNHDRRVLNSTGSRLQKSRIQIVPQIKGTLNVIPRDWTTSVFLVRFLSPCVTGGIFGVLSLVRSGEGLIIIRSAYCM